MPSGAANNATATSGTQAARFVAATNVLERAVADHVFPGAVFSVLHRGAVVALGGVGRFAYDAASPQVTAHTIYDLASLTKVVATTSMAMLLYERGRLDLDAPVTSALPEFAAASVDDVRRRRVSVRMLLTHSSGLPAYARFFEQNRTRQDLLTAALTLPLEAEPGERAEYSDIGFIVLDSVLERIADETLDTFCAREVFQPLRMTHSLFNPPKDDRQLIPPTEDDRQFRKRIVQGEVNDENAWVLGGAAGHAGLFATAGDLATFSHCLLTGGAPVFKPETVTLFTTRTDSPAGTSRALGWDTPSGESQAGRYFSARAFGHLGFTGTSLWLDPERQLSVALLSNRTWPSRDQSAEAIKKVRPAFHNSIVEALA